MAYFDIGHEPRLDPPEYEVPICPCCQQECERYYLNLNREHIGCDNCFDDENDEYDSAVDAYDWIEQRKEWGIAF